MKPVPIHPVSTLAGAAAFALLLSLTSLGQQSGRRASGRQLASHQDEVLHHLSIVYLPDSAGGTVKTIRLSDANFQLVNGLGATNGDPAAPEDSIDPTLTTTNGLGNLFVGYYENLAKPIPCFGSHNVILGQTNEPMSFGGLVGGRSNVMTEPYSTILTGRDNRTEAPSAIIVGGEANGATVLAPLTVVSGGFSGILPCIHDWLAGTLLQDE